LTTLLCALPLQAQVQESKSRSVEVSLDYRFIPPHGLLRPRAGAANDAGVRVRPWLVNARVSRPWRIEAWDATLTAAIGYEYLKFEYENWDFNRDPARVDALHSIQFRLGFARRLNERWSWRLMGGPSLNSDLKALTAKSLRAHGFAGLEYSLAQRDKLGLGLVYAQVFGKNLVLPGVFYHRRRESYRVEIMPPARAAAYWLARKNLDLGLLLNFSGNNYRIEAPGELHGKRVEYSLGTFGPSVIWRIAPGCAWNFDAGMVLRHRYAVMDGRELYRDLDMKRSVFVGMGARLGF